MLIKNVTILQIECQDVDCSEAEIFFEIGETRLWAFCHPNSFVINEKTEVTFDFIEEDLPEHIFWTENKENKIQILPDEKKRCRYICQGQITKIHPVEINCGILSIVQTDWINDESVIGKFVYFVIDRLDISRSSL